MLHKILGFILCLPLAGFICLAVAVICFNAPMPQVLNKINPFWVGATISLAAYIGIYLLFK